MGFGNFFPFFGEEEQQQQEPSIFDSPMFQEAQGGQEMNWLLAPEEETASMESPIVMPPRIGEGPPPTMDIMEQYKDWLSRRPEGADFKASTGRKILAGLAGFLVGLKDPKAGYEISRGIVTDPYNTALGEWQHEGKSIGEVGKFAQDVTETQRKRADDVMDYSTAQGRIETAESAIRQRKEAEDLRHQDRMTASTNEKERATEIVRHNKEMEKLAKAKNLIDQHLADSRRMTAESYSSRVEDLNSTEKPPKPVPYNSRNEATMDAILELFAENPEAERWFQRDPGNKRIIYPKPGMKLSPDELIQFKTFMQKARVKAESFLGTDFVEPLRPDF